MKQRDVSAHEEATAPTHQRFIEHIRSGTNELINDDGKLLNKGKVFSDKNLPNTIGWISLTP